MFRFQPLLEAGGGSGKGEKMTLCLQASEAPHRQPLKGDEHRERLTRRNRLLRHPVTFLGLNFMILGLFLGVFGDTLAWICSC